MHEEIQRHALDFRRRRTGVKVGREQDDRLFNRPLETYVPELVRATRNSSHGFLAGLTGGERFLLATHDGHMPRQLADLIAFFLFGFAADAGAVCEGRWFAGWRRRSRRGLRRVRSNLFSRLLRLPRRSRRNA